MRFTINSTRFGEHTFFMPDNGGYVRLECGAQHGTLGQQICNGGGFRGYTVVAMPGTFQREVRRWWRQHLRREED